MQRLYWKNIRIMQFRFYLYRENVILIVFYNGWLFLVRYSFYSVYISKIISNILRREKSSRGFLLFPGNQSFAYKNSSGVTLSRRFLFNQSQHLTRLLLFTLIIHHFADLLVTFYVFVSRRVRIMGWRTLRGVVIYLLFISV